jgi:arylsulfatase
MALGSRFSGWSLFLEQGRPVFVYARSIRPQDVTRIAAKESLGGGEVRLHLRFETQGPAKPGHVEILADGKPVASGDIASTFVLPLGVGEQFDAGRDTGVPVTDYPVPGGSLEGRVRHVSIDYD